MSTELSVAHIIASIQPKQRGPWPDPECCDFCKEAHFVAVNREDWRDLHRAKAVAAEIRHQDAAS